PVLVKADSQRQGILDVVPLLLLGGSVDLEVIQPLEGGQDPGRDCGVGKFQTSPAKLEDVVHPVGAGDLHVQDALAGQKLDAVVGPQGTLDPDEHLVARVEPFAVEVDFHAQGFADKWPFLVVRLGNVQQAVKVLLYPVETTPQVVMVILGQGGGLGAY